MIHLRFTNSNFSQLSTQAATTLSASELITTAPSPAPSTTISSASPPLSNLQQQQQVMKPLLTATSQPLQPLMSLKSENPFAQQQRPLSFGKATEVDNSLTTTTKPNPFANFSFKTPPTATNLSGANAVSPLTAASKTTLSQVTSKTSPFAGISFKPPQTPPPSAISSSSSFASAAGNTTPPPPQGFPMMTSLLTSQQQTTPPARSSSGSSPASTSFVSPSKTVIPGESYFDNDIHLNTYKSFFILIYY